MFRNDPLGETILDDNGNFTFGFFDHELQESGEGR